MTHHKCQFLFVTSRNPSNFECQCQVCSNHNQNSSTRSYKTELRGPSGTFGTAQLVVARAQAVARDRFLFGYQTTSKVPTEKNTTYQAGKVMKNPWIPLQQPEELERKDDGPIWSLAKFVKKLQVAVIYIEI